MKLSAFSNASSITISPNPVINKEINLRINKPEPGNYNISVYNLEGKLIKKSSVNISADQTLEKIQLKKSIGSGNYNVVIIDSKQNKRNISIQIL